MPDTVDETPKGKRTLRETIYGNINGYVGGKFWTTFGDRFDYRARTAADEWVKGGK